MKNLNSAKQETYEVESWRDFDDLNLKTPHCVYRGQSSSSWDLATGYERNWKVLNPMQEKEMLRRFISEAGIYSSNLPGHSDFISWLSLMQHYGAETRLLDVTRSKYIALFFALTGMMKDGGASCAVWAFDTYASNINFYNAILRSDTTGCIDTRDEPLASTLEEYKELGWRFANKFIVSDWEQEISKINTDDFVEKHMGRLNPLLTEGGVMEVVPQMQNERMVAQAAEFLMPMTLRKTFMSNLSEGRYSPKVVKLEIQKKLCGDFLRKLKEMNITWQTIYPDISGLARDMNW